MTASGVGPFDRLLEWPAGAPLPPRVRRRRVRLDPLRPPLVPRQHWQPRNRPIRIRHDALQQHPPLADHPLDGRSVEKVDGIIDVECHAAARLLHEYREIELRALAD